jgi:hypothetical protein
MKVFSVKYIYQECNTLEELHFRIESFEKQGYKWCSSGIFKHQRAEDNYYWLVVANTPIRNVSAILKEVRCSTPTTQK